MYQQIEHLSRGLLSRAKPT